ncbi:MAG: histidine phosphatase family protein [Pyrinomonadaceae bacterium]
MPTRFILIPHCETDFNLQKRLQGQLDIPLNDHGLRQATSLVEVFRDVSISAIFSSDLSRCVETARPLARSHGLKVIVHDGLRGRRYGILQGMLYSEIKRIFPAFYRSLKHRHQHVRFCEPGGAGESLSEFNGRSLHAVSDCLTRGVVDCGSDAYIAIVTHGGVLRVVNKNFKRPLFSKGKVLLKAAACQSRESVA